MVLVSWLVGMSAWGLPVQAGRRSLPFSWWSTVKEVLGLDFWGHCRKVLCSASGASEYCWFQARALQLQCSSKVTDELENFKISLPILQVTGYQLQNFTVTLFQLYVKDAFNGLLQLCRGFSNRKITSAKIRHSILPEFHWVWLFQRNHILDGCGDPSYPVVCHSPQNIQAMWCYSPALSWFHLVIESVENSTSGEPICSKCCLNFGSGRFEDVSWHGGLLCYL